MIAKVNTKVGSVQYQFEIDEKSEMDTLHKIIVLGNPPLHCNECNEEDVYMDSNKDKEGNTYINVVCKACTAKAKLGQYKTGGYFWHDFKRYVKEGNNEQQSES